MEQVERIGVSLEKQLLAKFDKLIAKQGYPSRSEAIRDLIRRQINSDRLSEPKAKAIAVVSLVYDHHAANLMQKLTELQHSHLLQTISSLHIHLDHHNCLEIVVLKGRVSEINKVADKIISLKGTRFGKVNFIPSEHSSD